MSHYLIFAKASQRQVVPTTGTFSF